MMHVCGESDSEVEITGLRAPDADGKLSLITYGYSDNENLCLKLWRSSDLLNLEDAELSVAQSEVEIEDIIRNRGDLELWRNLKSTATISCKPDGNFIN